MANITGAYHAALKALDSFVPTLYSPFPVLRCTLEDSECFVDWGSTHASKEAEMLMINRDMCETSCKETASRETRKIAYQTRDYESWRCQKEMDTSQSYVRHQSMSASSSWGPALLPGWSKNVGTSFTKQIIG